MMKEPPASDGFIICMRENSKHMVKLPHILQMNRKICDNKKARNPKERNDEENNQQDHHRLLPAFSTRVAAVALLEHQGNEAPQHPYSVPAQGDDEEDQGHPNTKECCSMPDYSCCRKQPGDQEIQSKANPL